MIAVRDGYNYVIVINYSDLGVIDCKVGKCNVIVIASCAVIDVIDSITANYSNRIYILKYIYSYKIKRQSYSYSPSATSHHHNYD